MARALVVLLIACARRGYRLEEVGSSEPSHGNYRKALWTVVLLNLGYGVVEIVGGIIADSQALKADALDFLGDGLITLLGVLAIGWSLAWRARSALLQGTFLGVLGVGVLVNTAYRFIVHRQPEAELMGILGVVALLVNFAAAAVLIVASLFLHSAWVIVRDARSDLASAGSRAGE